MSSPNTSRDTIIRIVLPKTRTRKKYSFKITTFKRVDEIKTTQWIESHGISRKLYPICEREEDKQMCKDLYNDKHKDHNKSEAL